MKKEDNVTLAASAALQTVQSQVEAAKAAVQNAFPGGGILVGAFVAGKTVTRSGKSKKDGSGYTMSTTPAVVGGRFASLMEYTRAENAHHQEFQPGAVVVQARNVAADPKNPAILRISLTEVEDAI